MARKRISPWEDLRDEIAEGARYWKDIRNEIGRDFQSIQADHFAGYLEWEREIKEE